MKGEFKWNFERLKSISVELQNFLNITLLKIKRVLTFFFFCWENFLTVSKIFFPVLENFQLLAASFFYGDPQNCVITIHSIYTVSNHIL